MSKIVNKSIYEPGTILYIVGGGAKLPAYINNDRSPIFCKEVIVCEKNLGNYKNKTCVINEGEEKLVRNKRLFTNLFDAYIYLEHKLNDIRPYDKLDILMKYMKENHSEYLV